MPRKPEENIGYGGHALTWEENQEEASEQVARQEVLN